MITERDINICDNDRTRDGVRAGLMNTFNKDNDPAHSSLLPTQRKLMQMLQLILTNVCQPGWRDDYCVVFLLWTLFWTCLNNIWGGIRVGVMMKGTNVCPVAVSWSSDLHTLSICYHRDSAHINIFIFTLTRQGLQPHTHIWPHNGEVTMIHVNRSVLSRKIFGLLDFEFIIILLAFAS